jgi:gluconokinase
MTQTPIPPSSSAYPAVVFLFGLSGAGKNYCGRLFAPKMEYFFYDLDADLTPAMRSAIAEGRPFTDEIRDEFFDVVIERISQLKEVHPRLLLAQGAYKERHRIRVKNAHPGLEFLWVDAPDAVILSRIEKRGGGVSSAYASSIRVNFEAPTGGTRVLNDGVSDELLWERFKACFAA